MRPAPANRAPDGGAPWHWTVASTKRLRMHDERHAQRRDARPRMTRSQVSSRWDVRPLQACRCRIASVPGALGSSSPRIAVFQPPDRPIVGLQLSLPMKARADSPRASGEPALADRAIPCHCDRGSRPVDQLRSQRAAVRPAALSEVEVSLLVRSDARRCALQSLAAGGAELRSRRPACWRLRAPPSSWSARRSS